MDASIIAAFIREVRLEMCAESHRGSISSAGVGCEIRSILPSALKALHVLGEKIRLEDKTGMSYNRNWQCEIGFLVKMDHELSP